MNKKIILVIFSAAGLALHPQVFSGEKSPFDLPEKTNLLSLSERAELFDSPEEDASPSSFETGTFISPMQKKKWKESRLISKRITKKRHIRGIFLSVVPGFGIGHAVQGRYKTSGWIFTVLEGAAIGSYIVSDALLTDETRKNEWLLWLFIVVFSALKTGEIIDAWILPSHYTIKRENISQANITHPYNEQKNTTHFGLSVEYTF